MKGKSITKDQESQQVMIIGVGGFGCKVAALMQERGFTETVACDTDQQDLQSIEVTRRLLLDSKQPSLFARIVDKSLDYLCATEGDNNCGQDYLEFAVEPFSQLMEDDANTVIIVAGLGGSCGTNAIAQIAREAKAAGKHTAAVVTLPFPFEGSKRMNRAFNGLSELAPQVGKLLVLNTHNLIDGNTTAAKAIAQAEKIVCGEFNSLCDWNTMKNGDADSRKVEAN